jgi:hypothetical protein
VSFFSWQLLSLFHWIVPFKKKEFACVYFIPIILPPPPQVGLEKLSLSDFFHDPMYSMYRYSTGQVYGTDLEECEEDVWVAEGH